MEQTNQNFIKVPKVFKQTNDKTLGTSVWFIDATESVLTNRIECENMNVYFKQTNERTIEKYCYNIFFNHLINFFILYQGISIIRECPYIHGIV